MSGDKNKENEKKLDHIDFEPAVDAKVTLSVSQHKTKAFLVVSPPRNGGRTLDRDLIEEALAKEGIRFGLNEPMIEQLVRLKAYGKKILVAEAQLPVHGIDEVIQYHFETSKSRRPKLLSDGTVDFKQIGFVKNVRKYDVLCSKTPATSGVAGIDVCGEEIPATPGKEIPFKSGKNTIITRDGKQLCAGLDGQVDIVGESVEVQEILQIDGDVDLSTGNINYIGSVLVRGSIKSGFEVAADGSITVLGSVEGAKLTAGGNIVIEQGFAGMNTGVIKTNGDLRCKYIQNGIVHCEMNLETGMIVTSNVKVGATCKVLGSSSAVLSSHIVARHNIECIDVGSPTAAKESVLEVGSDPRVLQRAKEIPLEQDSIIKRVRDIERATFLFKQLAAAGRLSEDNRQKQEKLQEEQEKLQARQVELMYEKQEIDRRLMTSGYGTITIFGKLFPGTRIIIGQDQLKVDLPQRNVTFSRGETGIAAKPAKE